MTEPRDEGERPQETPPGATPLSRGLRTMAIVRWVLLGIVALVAASTWWLYVLRPHTPDTGPDRYYCPMHPQIRSKVPGTCPICFMNLEPIPEERRGGKPAAPAQSAPPPRGPGEAPEGLSEVMLSRERRVAVGIATTGVEKRSVARELRLPAVIEAPERAVSEVRVRTAGFVERVAPVETGQSVRAGAPLLWLYSPEILRAEEELLAARRMAQAPSTNGSGVANDGHELGSQMVGAARRRLVLLGVHETDIDALVTSGHAERLVAVRAPASGIVTQRNVAVGTYATPEMMLFQVTDLSKLWASATVAAEELSEVVPGVPGRFVSRGSERSYDVTASLVEPQVSTATRAGRIRFTASNADGLLRPGDIGEVLVSLPAREYMLVPRDAVIDVGTARYVYVESAEDVFTARLVELGPLLGDERAILSGLEAGARIVARGAFLLDSESRLGAALTPSAPSAAPSAAHQHEGHP